MGTIAGGLHIEKTAMTPSIGSEANAASHYARKHIYWDCEEVGWRGLETWSQ